jgi:hypothetical protein
MKLNSTQLEQTLSQFEAEVVPDDHPAVPQLKDLFGNHTFFLDTRGLKCWSPRPAGEGGAKRRDSQPRRLERYDAHQPWAARADRCGRGA